MLKMDQHVERLSEDTLDFRSSFENSPLNHAVSFKRSVYRTQDMSNSYIMLNNSDDCVKEDTFGSYVSSKYMNGTEHGLSSIINRLQNLSLGHKQWTTDSQLKELKDVISKVNNAYVQWIFSQFVLDSCKSVEQSVHPKLAKKLKDSLSSSSLQRVSTGTSRSGCKFNVLGLTHDASEISSNFTFSETEELKKCVLEKLRTNLEKLKSQRKVLKDTFGRHCLKIVSASSLVPEEQDSLAQDSLSVERRLAEAQRVLVSTNHRMLQLTELSRRTERDAQLALCRSLRDKASCLHTTTSVLKLKMEKYMNRDRSEIQASNILGDRLKKTESEKSEQLKGLEQVLSKYEMKMESSKQFSEIVSEYAKVKRQIQHKYQTLSVLNDPNFSF